MLRYSALYLHQDTSIVDIDCKITMSHELGAISDHGNIRLLGNGQYQSNSKTHSSEENPNYKYSKF